MRKIKLVDATQPELLAYCRIILNLPIRDIPDNTGISKLIAKISAVLPPETDEIELPDAIPGVEYQVGQGSRAAVAAPKTDSAGRKKAVVSHGLYDPPVMLTIYDTEQNKGRPVEVSVNGRTMLIPVGTSQRVPYRYFLALQNAVQTNYNYDTTSNENVPQVTVRYQVNVSVMPSVDDINLWNQDLMEDMKQAPAPVPEEAAA
jgi:hypothetical protein